MCIEHSLCTKHGCCSSFSISITIIIISTSSWASKVSSGKEPACQRRRRRFNPWVRKIPWTEKPGGLQFMRSATEHIHTNINMIS